MKPSATQSCTALVQCLDLSRPESISTAGYCADVRTQATKWVFRAAHTPALAAKVNPAARVVLAGIRSPCFTLLPRVP